MSDRRTKAPRSNSLEQTDDEATLDRFMDLPPELRTRIYALYFQELKLPLCPKQPPLLEVSRHVRREALELFYSSCNFELRVEKFYNGHGPGPGRRLVPKYEVQLNTLAAQFFNNTPESFVNRITRLHTSLASSPHNCPPDRSSPWFWGWELDLYPLASDDGAIHIDQRTAQISETLPDPGITRQMHAVTGRLESVSNVIIARSEAHKLRRRDFEAIVTASE